MLRTLALALALVAVGATGVLAGPYDWPGNCADNEEGNKQAIRVYSARDWTGSQDTECGNFWQTGDLGARDDHFGQGPGEGTIAGFDNLTESWVVMNKSPNEGACVTLYAEPDYSDGGALAGWRRMSVWVLPRLFSAKYSFTRIQFSGSNDFGVSSGKAWSPSASNHDTQAECHADSFTQVVYREYGYKDSNGNIVFP